MYKNPIPCLPEDEKYYEFRIHFKFPEPLTRKEAAESLTEYFKENGITPEMISDITSGRRLGGKRR